MTHVSQILDIYFSIAEKAIKMANVVHGSRTPDEGFANVFAQFIS